MTSKAQVQNGICRGRASAATDRETVAASPTTNELEVSLPMRVAVIVAADTSSNPIRRSVNENPKEEANNETRMRASACDAPCIVALKA
jgi:hypothetical protein